MTDNDPFGQGSGQPGKDSWFGPKRFGYGYAPQTWQGFVLVGLAVAIVAVMAAIFGGHSPIMVLAVVPLGAVAIFARVQGRR
jgi:hypothetical protein